MNEAYRLGQKLNVEKKLQVENIDLLIQFIIRLYLFPSFGVGLKDPLIVFSDKHDSMKSNIEIQKVLNLNDLYESGVSVIIAEKLNRKGNTFTTSRNKMNS